MFTPALGRERQAWFAPARPSSLGLARCLRRPPAAPDSCPADRRGSRTAGLKGGE